MIYNPHAWYWLASDGRLFSSAAQALIQDTEQSYVDWIAAGGVPTGWPRDEQDNQTDAALQAVLDLHGMFANLNFYTLSKRWLTETGGMTVTLTSGPMPIKTDDRAQANINGQRLTAQADPTFTTRWHAADHTIHPLTAAEVIDMSEQLQAHVTDCFDTSATLFTGIADGSITTRAQIDAAFAAIVVKYS
jgi:hypothetical protein